MTYEIQARGPKHAEIFVHESIGAGGQTSKALVDDLKKLPGVSRITVRINSDGGSVSDALAIYNTLKQHKATVNVVIEGFALSAASVIAMAGDTIAMADNALMMIHDPLADIGTSRAQEMRTGAEALDRVKASLVAIYVGRTGKSESEITELMAAETWFTAAEAQENGFCDEIINGIEVAASFDITRFKNLPKQLTDNMKTQVTNQTQSPQAIAETAVKAERQRVNGILNLFKPECYSSFSELKDECIGDHECTIEAAGKRLLAKMAEGAKPVNDVFASPLSIQMVDRTSEFKAAATDALLMREGINITKPHAAAQDLVRMSIADLAQSSLSQRGVSVRGLGSSQILAKAMSHSTSDFPALLGNVASKALMNGFDNEPASHGAWVRVTDIGDFKEVSRTQRSEAPSLLEVNEGGEFTHGSLGELAEKYSLATYGRLFSITRQALINDDLNAFTTLPQAFGASGRRLEADKIYEHLTDNAPMADGTDLFHADHRNVITGASGLTVDDLASARTVMRKQKGPAGVGLLNIVPRYLIVPAAMETEGELLIASMTKPGQSNSEVTNADFVKNLELIVDARLDEASETTYYLAASHNQTDTIEIAYLEGERGISYEEELGFEVDGLQVKARLDFGSKPIDHRGLVRVTV